MSIQAIQGELSSQIVLSTAIAHTLLQLAATGAAVAAIYFGYRLFFLAESKNTGEFEVSGAFGKVHLARVAPGVFFTLFGCVVLVVALLHPVQFQLTVDPAFFQTVAKSALQDQAAGTHHPPPVETLLATGLTGVGSSPDPKTCARSTYFLISTVQAEADYLNDPVVRRNYTSSLDQAERLLAYCVDASLGVAGTYARYKNVAEKISTNPGIPNEFSAEDNEAYKMVSKLLSR